ncbi:DNA topoisomerase 2 [Massospora cicadina]|nr:DNA topoisomerase 2 [Massospora cicadina]
MIKIKITIDLEQSLISVCNNSSGILVEIHKEEKVYTPELIFGYLLTSSNYDDSKKKVFQMNHLNAEIMGLLKCMFLNNSNIKLNNSKDYIQMYLKSAPGLGGEDLTKRLVGFINSILTFKGGIHANYVVDVISKILPEVFKGNMWIFVNCLIDNPSFNSQTKENMTLKPTSFGSRCKLTEKLQAGVLMLGIINMLTALSQAKDNMAMVEALNSTKCGSISGIPNLEDANKAGT